MKKLGLILVCVLLSYCLFGDDDNALIEKIEQTLVFKTAVQVEEIMVIEKPDSPKKTYRQVIYKLDENVIIKFLEPKIEKGRIILVKDNQGFMFFPNSSKTMRVNLQSGLMGGGIAIGDFTGDILLNFKIVDKQEKETKDGETYFIFELDKLPDAHVGYSKIRYFIKEDGTPIKKEFYSLSGKLLKTLYFHKLEEMNGKLVTSLWQMKSNITTEITTIKIVSVNNKVKLTKDMFTTSYIDSMMR